ncbi:hypothetical protein GCM10011609_88030 [Lentzea pudingi]|uniref:VOC domain-containing protein n=1 Tax=Lentzea pudingi TaxID=1789439 RepID=A0ABQ2IUX0_9PSEU|nr:VOC family protein [Lentzea pudingi]GGN30309.1 hypothetical protein GCM10011609_88030 [Lentzea pudingi]
MDKVFWFDVPVRDIDEASEFYHEVFGWEVRPKHSRDGDDALSFRMAFTAQTDDKNTPLKPGAINGGVVTRNIGITQPTILVEVDDVDEKIEKLLQAGGSMVTEKVSLPLANGNFAYAKDPDGNVLGLWEWAK